MGQGGDDVGSSQSGARFYAHSLENRPTSEWQLLEDHLRSVGERAGAFARAFCAEDWACQAGRWHDLGKYSAAFQDYLKVGSDTHVAECAARTDHSTAGAQHAVDSIDIHGHLLAYAIAGHHSGLLDARKESGANQEDRLAKKVEPWDSAADEITATGATAIPSVLRNALGRPDAYAAALFTRMLYSCLVDADFLDTEEFMSPERASSRPTWPANILELMSQALDSHLAGLSSGDTSVNRRRKEVLEACVGAARKPPGIFSLTVPTGGGKTLSSLAFALRHAIAHGLERVVFVVPFTSIIEQNAEVFRDVMTPLGEQGIADPVLEHHSNVDVAKQTMMSRLAAENWDAPLVVTTSVQFYESLHANRSSRCRKLHNLAKAVIILDEAQTLPVEFLDPCLRALGELASGYQSSVVLCTATQPAISRRDDFPIGLSEVREIIPHPAKLYSSMKRVSVSVIGRQTDAELAASIGACEQVLCIVNTRSHARVLFELLSEDDATIHLSALMCPEHRSEVLARVRGRLVAGCQCRVVSTQLVEAGVDLDFPVVYRSMSGLDSIAQAAGRCNRNGCLAGGGQVFVFCSEHTLSERYFRDTTEVASQLVGLYPDLLDPEATEHYFRLYYWDQAAKWDAKGIVPLFRLDGRTPKLPYCFSFSEVAKRFRLIADASKPVVIPWQAKGQALCERLRRAPECAWGALLRQAQRYTVQIPTRIWQRHLGASFELVHDRFPVLLSPELHYSQTTGLNLEAEQPTFLEI